MAKFRKKPVVIEAMLCRELILGALDNWRVPSWFRDAYEKGGVVLTMDAIHLPTLERTMIAKADDWVICGVKGEVYPCKPDIFAATYEPA